MPLFVYICPNCKYVVEKLQFDNESLKVECEKCKILCEKQMPFARSKVMLDAKDTLNESIIPEANRICSNIHSGKDEDFLDICGE